MAISKKQIRKKRKRRILRILKGITALSVTAVSIYMLILGVQYWLRHTEVFKVNDVEITGMRLIEVGEIRKMIELQESTRLFEVDLEPIKENIISHPYVASAALGRSYPSTIKIDIEERVPVAYLVLKQMFLVDDKCYLLPKLNGKVAEADYPVITGIKTDKVLPGNHIDDTKLSNSLMLIKKLRKRIPEIYNSISEIHCAGDGSLNIFLSKNGLRIDFGIAKFDYKITKLQYFLKHHNEREYTQNLSYINLNYKDQIVVKEQL